MNKINKRFFYVIGVIIYEWCLGLKYIYVVIDNSMEGYIQSFPLEPHFLEKSVFNFLSRCEFEINNGIL